MSCFKKSLLTFIHFICILYLITYKKNDTIDSVDTIFSNQNEGRMLYIFKLLNRTGMTYIILDIVLVLVLPILF